MDLFKTNIIFALLSVLFLSSLSAGAQSTTAVELKTVVIDAGHGGKDPGAKNGKIYEKNITLSIALKLGAMIKEKYPSVKVIYTRTTDRFVELHERAAIANRNHADLFLSIHVNSARNTSARGHETFVMGTEKNSANMEVCQLENSVVVLEDDYSSKYAGFDPDNPESYIIFSLLQNSHLEQSLKFATAVQANADKGPVYRNRGVKQANFLVLWRCTMPAVLIEVGFISNPTDLKTITTSANQKKIAQNIFRAFETYKRGYDTEMYLPDGTDAAAGDGNGIAPEKKDMQTAAEGTGTFGIQVFASSRLLKNGDPAFKGWNCRQRKSGNLYKYYIGAYRSREEAAKDLRKVKESFPNAFIIQTEP